MTIIRNEDPNTMNNHPSWLQSLIPELQQTTTTKEVIELIIENCWFDWQQDEALEWCEANLPHYK
tara:strand:+ start:2203 stop:2397 length:195 start_codon:yes stop_codon:yes gene_type:complete